MYDTVDLKLIPNEKGIDLIEHVGQFLTSVTNFNNSHGDYWIIGNLKNLKVIVNGSYVKIKDNSLCKFVHDNNYSNLTINDTKLAIEEISDHLNLPMKNALVQRVDFGANIILDHPVEAYLPYLGEYGHFKRLEQVNGLYYKVNNKMSCFYNKIKELKDHRHFVPDYLKDKYLLRYEMRYLKGLNKEFNRELIASQLYDEAFFELLVERWKLNYFKIKKVNNMIMKLKPTGSKIEFRNNLALLALLSEGQSAIIKQINEWQALGDITKKQAFDLRQLTKSLGEKTLLERNSLIDELSEKIENYNPY